MNNTENMKNIELSDSDMERKVISEEVCRLEDDKLHSIEKLVADYGEHLSIEVETQWSYGDHEIYIKVSRSRLETDEEYEDRIRRTKEEAMNDLKIAQKKQAAREAEERRLYLELKAKFEGQS